MDAAHGEAKIPAEQEAVPLTTEIADEPVNDIESAVQRVLNDAAIEEGIKIGVNQVIKAIEARVAHYVFLAADISDPTIKKAVTLLAKQMNIRVVEVPHSKDLGQWAGLCKVDREGQNRKIRSASCVALLKCSRKSNASMFLEKYVAEMPA